jgi:hypothetical protein
VADIRRSTTCGDRLTARERSYDLAWRCSFRASQNARLAKISELFSYFFRQVRLEPRSVAQGFEVHPPGSPGQIGNRQTTNYPENPSDYALSEYQTYCCAR